MIISTSYGRRRKETGWSMSRKERNPGRELGVAKLNAGSTVAQKSFDAASITEPTKFSKPHKTY